MTAGDRLSRRTLLGGAAAVGLVVGAGATEAGNAIAGGGTTYPATEPPGERLMEEHGVLKRVLLVYQAAVPRLANDLPVATAALHGGAEIVHDYIEEFHEALEEGYVFPALRQAGQLVPTVDTLLLQHARGRLITQLLLNQATPGACALAATRTRVESAVDAFVRMYEPHEAREDTVVFPAYRALLSPSERNRVGEAFAGLQDRQLGADALATVTARVAALEGSLGIADLASFTPAPVDPLA